MGLWEIIEAAGQLYRLPVSFRFPGGRDHIGHAGAFEQASGSHCEFAVTAIDIIHDFIKLGAAVIRAGK